MGSPNQPGPSAECALSNRGSAFATSKKTVMGLDQRCELIRGRVEPTSRTEQPLRQHAVLRERASLAGANHRGAAESFYGWQMLNQGVTLRHALSLACSYSLRSGVFSLKAKFAMTSFGSGQ